MERRKEQKKKDWKIAYYFVYFLLFSSCSGLSTIATAMPTINIFHYFDHAYTRHRVEWVFGICIYLFVYMYELLFRRCFSPTAEHRAPCTVNVKKFWQKFNLLFKIVLCDGDMAKWTCRYADFCWCCSCASEWRENQTGRLHNTITLSTIFTHASWLLAHAHTDTFVRIGHEHLRQH